MAEKAKKKTAAAKVEKLPENWNTLSMEEKYNLVNEKLHKLADIDCDWDVDIKLQSGGSGNGCCSYIEWTDWSCVLDEEDASFKPCKFVRKKPVTFGKVVLADFPPELQKELKEEDWSDNDDGDIPNIFDSRLEGKDWTDCLEKTFVRLELLKLGYEICWECKEYRNDHREFFEKYFEAMEELFGSGNDEGDKDDDIGIDLDDLEELLREEKKSSDDDDDDL